VYDMSGPYSDPALDLDLAKGLSALRQPWIDERSDTEVLAQSSSYFSQTRDMDLRYEQWRMKTERKPRRALPGNNVTQLHYARQGIITPEMEY
ncbi:phosphomethylpyrimidine synthase ThiC, partial [Gilvimarinus sp. 1_MG-2023]|nr:phosphomethylpyrimidine synthase ThiC [Gilvimarinus sp. 1_MG-2023]